MTIALARFDRALSRIETPLNLIGGVFVLALAALGAMQVIMRTFFGMPIMGYIDIIEQGTAVFAFLGLAYTQAQGGHIRMEILLQALPSRGFWSVEVLNSTFALVVTCLLLPGSWLHFQRAFLIGDSTMSIGFPTWPSKLLVFLALCMLALRLVLQVWGNLRMTIYPDAEPISVNPPANVAEVAAEEVELSQGGRS